MRDFVRKWSLLMAFASSFLAAVIAVAIAGYIDHRSSQKWCEVVSTLDDAYKANPPTTPVGQKLAEDMAKLRRDFDC